jgi:hypothetical protein
LLAPDFEHSDFNPTISNGDWIASDISIKEISQFCFAKFGKPDLSISRQDYLSRVKLQLTLQRTRITSFTKLCRGVDAAALVSGETY